MLKEKECKLKIWRYLEIRSIASKFGIDQLVDVALMGTFTEMQERSKQSTTIDEWKEKGEIHNRTHLSPIIIPIEKELTESINSSRGKKI